MKGQTQEYRLNMLAILQFQIPENKDDQRNQKLSPTNYTCICLFEFLPRSQWLDFPVNFFFSLVKSPPRGESNLQQQCHMAYTCTLQ